MQSLLNVSPPLGSPLLIKTIRPIYFWQMSYLARRCLAMSQKRLKQFHGRSRNLIRFGDKKIFQIQEASLPLF